MKTGTAAKQAWAFDVETLPDGVKVAMVHVSGWDEVKKMPQVMQIDGAHYVRTGWNSDTMVAYYRTGAVIGRAL